MAMGIPVITNAGVGDVADIVKKYNGGIVLTELSDTEFETVTSMIDSSQKFDATDIRRGAEEFYNLDNAVQKYLKIYREVLN